MTKQKISTPDDPTQSERFVEAARNEGIEAVGEEFKRAMGTLAPAKKPNASPTARKPKRAKRA